MKKIILVLGVLAFSLVFSAVTYAGTATGQLQVSATVAAVCTVSTTAVNFGDVTGLATVNATGDVTVNCSSGTPYHIALDKGLYGNESARRLGPTAGEAAYFLFQPAGGVEWGDFDYAGTYIGGTSLADTGNGSNQAHTVNAQLMQFIGFPAGTVLTDTVTVTVHY